VNLELPLRELDPSKLDEGLARMDRDLERLFLDEVEGTLARLRAERRPAETATGSAAA
jgi:hypothetical protein